MKHSILLLILFLIFINTNAQQNVGIGTTTPDSSAILDVKSTNKGFLMPRMNSLQMITISNPALGLAIYNTDSATICMYNGTRWIKLLNSTNAQQPISNLQNGGVVFVNNNQLTTNTNALFFDASQEKFGIGTSSPQNKLSVVANADQTIIADFGSATGSKLTLGSVNGKPSIAAKTNNLISSDTLVLNPGGVIQLPSLINNQSRSFVTTDSKGNLKDTVLGIANTTSSGFLSSSDWNTFNAKQNALAIANSNTSGILSNTDWNTFNNKSNFTLPSLTNGAIVYAQGGTVAQTPSQLFYDQTNSRVGIGTNIPSSKLEVAGLGGITVKTTNPGSGTTDWIALNAGGTAGGRVVMGNLFGKATIGAHNSSLNAWDTLVVNPGGVTQFPALAGMGKRFLTVNPNGILGDSVIATANANNTGFLSSTDWNSFNNKSNFTLPALTAGSVLFSDGTSIAQSNAQLNWDNTNKRLGIGTNTPLSTLDVRGAGGINVTTSNNGVGAGDWIAASFGKTDSNRVVIGTLDGMATIGAHNKNLSSWQPLSLNPGGNVKIPALAGTGTRLLSVNSTGLLVTSTLPTGDNFGNHVATQNIQLGNNWLSKNGANNGIAISDDGRVGINTSTPSGTLQIATASGGGFIVKDNGYVGIGTNAPTASLDVTGGFRFRTGAVDSSFLQSDANGNAYWSTNMASMAVSSLSADNMGIGTAPTANNKLTVKGKGGIIVSSTNNSIDATDWIALNAGSGSGNRVVSGNLYNVPTIGGHNNAANAWTNLVINPTTDANAQVFVGGAAGSTPTVNTNLNTVLPTKLVVNGSIRQATYITPVSIGGNNVTTILWNHNLGYGPIVMMSLDENGGGIGMDYCYVTTYNTSENTTAFKIRNWGTNTATGNLRWILVW